jgi:hypothetical protein
VTSQVIADAGTGQVVSPGEAVQLVTATARPCDVVLVMGSGPLSGQVCEALSALQSA